MDKSGLIRRDPPAGIALVVNISRAIGIMGVALVLTFILGWWLDRLHTRVKEADMAQLGHDPLVTAMHIVTEADLDNPVYKADLIKRIALASMENGHVDQGIRIGYHVRDPYLRAEIFSRAAGALVDTPDSDRVDALLNKAMTELGKLGTTFPDARVLSLIARTYIKIDRLDLAILVANRTREPQQRAEILMHMATECNMIGRSQQMANLLDLAALSIYHIGDANSREILSQIAVEYARIGRLDNALKVRDTLDTVEVKAETGGIIAATLPASYKQQSAELWAQVRQEVQALPDTKARARVLGNVAVRFALMDHTEQALDIAETIPDGFQRAETLYQIARHCAQHGDLVETTLDVLMKIGQAIASMEYMPEQDYIMVMFSAKIAALYAEIHMTDHTRTILKELITIAEQLPDEQRRNSAMAMIAWAYAEVGAYQEALSTICGIHSEPARTDALVDVLIQYARASTSKEEPKPGPLPESTSL